MSNTWFVGDLHLGHNNIITFKGNDGEKIRPFATIEEHDETLINNINAVVKPEDRLYLMGDIVINRKHLPQLAKINGRKKLIKGNHDIFKLKDYSLYVDDIISYRIYQDHGLIFSHIPVHPCQLERRFKYNVHGHLHSNLVFKEDIVHHIEGMQRSVIVDRSRDNRYINICPEHTNWKPVSFDEICDKIGWKKNGKT